VFVRGDNMEDIKRRFIESLNNKGFNIEVAYGIKIYNRAKEICIRGTKPSIILRAFLEVSNKFFYDHFRKDSAEFLMDMAKKDILALERKCNQDQFDFKFRTLSGISNKVISLVYIDQHRLNLKEEYLKRKLYKDYKSIINASKEESKDFFINFNFLSKELEESGLSAPNLFEIILSFVKKNLKVFNEKQMNPIPDVEKIRNHKFKRISKKRIAHILDNDMLGDFLAEDYPTKKVKELKTFIEQNPLDISHYVKNCEIILQHYENPNGLTKEDIDSIYFALMELKVDEKLCRKIKTFLSKGLVTDRKEKTNVKPVQVVKEIKEVKTLSKKQTNLIIKELQQYFDFEKMKPTKTMTLNEIIYCISLMIKINADEKNIDNFLKVIEKENRKQNPIYLYANLYNKLMFYKNRVEVYRILNDIDEELQKMFICSLEDYDKIKSSIMENMKYVLNYIGNNYEYEKSEAKKMVFERSKSES